MKQTPETVILIDCGYDGIQKLARAVRDKQIYTMVRPCTAPADRVLAENPVGLVFVSGGNASRLADAEAKFSATALPKLKFYANKPANTSFSSPPKISQSSKLLLPLQPNDHHGHSTF